MAVTELVEPRSGRRGASAADDAAEGGVLRSGRTTERELWRAAAVCALLAALFVPLGLVGLRALAEGLRAAAAPGVEPVTGGRVLLVPFSGAALAAGCAVALAHLTQARHPWLRSAVGLGVGAPLGFLALGSSLLVLLGDAAGGGLLWPFLPMWASVVVVAPAPVHGASVAVRLLVAVTAVVAPFGAGPVAPGFAVILALMLCLPAALLADTLVGRLLGRP